MYKILPLLYMDKWAEETTWSYDVPNNKAYKMFIYYI